MTYGELNQIPTSYDMNIVNAVDAMISNSIFRAQLTDAWKTEIISDKDMLVLRDMHVIGSVSDRKAIKEARKMLQQYRDSIDYSVFDAVAICKYETCIAEINNLNVMLYGF